MSAAEFLVTLVLSVVIGVAGMTLIAMLAARLSHEPKRTHSDGETAEEGPAEEGPAAAGQFTLTGLPDRNVLRRAADDLLREQGERTRCALLLIAIVNLDAIQRLSVTCVTSLSKGENLGRRPLRVGLCHARCS